MTEMISIEQAKSVAYAAIQRSASRNYPTPAMRSHAFMEIFNAKLEHALEAQEKALKKIVKSPKEVVDTKPYLDLVSVDEDEGL